MYKVEKPSGDVVIDGFYKGIADSPYTGIADLKNANIITIPDEASVNFATARISPPAIPAGTVTSADAGTDVATFTGAAGLENRMTITFSAQSGLNVSVTRTVNDGVLNSTTTITSATINFSAGDVGRPIFGQFIPAGTTIASVTNATTAIMSNAATATVGGMQLVMQTPYWIKNLVGNTFQLSRDSTLTSTADLTNGTGTFSVATMGSNPLSDTIAGLTAVIDFAYDDLDDKYFALTSDGSLWSNLNTTPSGYWTFLGPALTPALVSSSGTNGLGLVYYQASDGERWIFVMHLLTIDYFTISTQTWSYGWDPATGTLNNAGSLTTAGGKAILGPDNKVYVASNNFILRWYQASPSVAFNPLVPSTYVTDRTAVLPFNDTARSLAFLGNNLLIGGRKNVIYPWDTFSQLASYPIFLAEYDIVQMVTVNTNTYALVGKRGRVYVSL